MISFLKPKVPIMAGYLLEKELKYLYTTFQQQNTQNGPFVAIIGGAKVNSKLSVLKSLLEKVDYLVIGGAMVFTFLKALGLEIGKSKIEINQIKNAKDILKLAKENR